MGVSKRAALTVLHQNGAAMRLLKLTLEAIEVAVSLYASVMSIKQDGADLGRPQQHPSVLVSAGVVGMRPKRKPMQFFGHAGRAGRMRIHG